MLLPLLTNHSLSKNYVTIALGWADYPSVLYHQERKLLGKAETLSSTCAFPHFPLMCLCDTSAGYSLLCLGAVLMGEQ